MTEVKLIALFTLAILFGALFTESKFGLQSPRSAGIQLRADTAEWKKTLVRWHDHIKYGGLFLLWLGSCAFAIQVRRQPGEHSFVLLAVAASGIAVYLIAVAWRLYVGESDTLERSEVSGHGREQ